MLAFVALHSCFGPDAGQLLLAFAGVLLGLPTVAILRMLAPPPLLVEPLRATHLPLETAAVDPKLWMREP